MSYSKSIPFKIYKELISEKDYSIDIKHYINRTLYPNKEDKQITMSLSPLIYEISFIPKEG
jgi:hypothetical protein